jgi:peptidoglycan hydrolase CwlO-like protein
MHLLAIARYNLTIPAHEFCLYVLQLADSQGQRQQLQSNLEELTADFQYNLQLLAERDAELEAADAAAANAAAEMAAKASAITQLQAQLAQARSGEPSAVVSHHDTASE